MIELLNIFIELKTNAEKNKQLGKITRFNEETMYILSFTFPLGTFVRVSRVGLCSQSAISVFAILRFFHTNFTFLVKTSVLTDSK